MPFWNWEPELIRRLRVRYEERLNDLQRAARYAIGIAAVLECLRFVKKGLLVLSLIVNLASVPVLFFYRPIASWLLRKGTSEGGRMMNSLKL